MHSGPQCFFFLFHRNRRHLCRDSTQIAANLDFRIAMVTEILSPRIAHNVKRHVTTAIVSHNLDRMVERGRIAIAVVLNNAAQVILPSQRVHADRDRSSCGQVIEDTMLLVDETIYMCSD